MAAEPEIVVVATIADHTRAEMARIALEEEGIDCMLMDENQAGFPDIQAIPVRVAVREEDAGDATQVLRENNLI